MNKPNIKFDAGTVLKCLSMAAAGFGFIVSSLLDAHNQKTLKAELKDEIKQELSNEQNQGTI